VKRKKNKVKRKNSKKKTLRKEFLGNVGVNKTEKKGLGGGGGAKSEKGEDYR
jgi:hypothetical protein